MYLSRHNPLPDPKPRENWDELLKRLLTGMAFFHAILKWISGALFLLILIVVAFVVLYLCWRGGGEVIEWADRVFSD